MPLHKSEEIKQFFRYTTLILISILVLATYPIYVYVGFVATLSFWLAMFLTYFNALVGYFYIDKYFSAAFNTFMKAVFSSMGLRLLLLAIIIVLILTTTSIHKISFTAGLFISYILFSIIEVIFIQKKASSKDT